MTLAEKLAQQLKDDIEANGYDPNESMGDWFVDIGDNQEYVVGQQSADILTIGRVDDEQPIVRVRVAISRKVDVTIL